MNLLAMLPSLLQGKTDVDELAKSLGLIKRVLPREQLETAFTQLIECTAIPRAEVIEVTGVIGGKKIRCILVAGEPPKD